MYCAPIFRNILTIHILSAFSYYPDSKYLTSGTQQRFVPAPVACISYQPHIVFSAYLSYSGRISVISERAAAIEYLIPEHFHLTLSMDKYLPLHISPFNVVAKMPRSSSVKQPTFLQCGRHTKFGSIIELRLPDLSTNFSYFCNIFPH